MYGGCQVGNPRRANGARRTAIRARLKASGRPCGICGAPIDYSAPYRLVVGYRLDGTPITEVNPEAFVVDEIVPVSRGGDPLDIANCQPAHFRCNAAKGNHMPGEQGYQGAGGGPDDREIARSIDI